MHRRKRRRINTSDSWSLVPLAKIIHAHSSLSRLLWAVFSITMVAGLFTGVLLTVYRYLDYATVFRMDYSTSKTLRSLPAILVCHSAHRIKPEMYRFMLSTFTPTQKANLETISYNQPRFTEPTWSTETAQSPIYRALRNFSIKFQTDPPQSLRMRVVEQFPRPRNQLCVDFQLSHSAQSPILIIQMNQTTTQIPSASFSSSSSLPDHFELVLHDKNTFPLDNYERFLYPKVYIGQQIYLFSSTSITKHLNTVRNPCRTDPITILRHNFSYDQTICKWKVTCDNMRLKCNCSCPLDVLGLAAEMPCNTASCPERILIDSRTCPQACKKIKYEELNVVPEATQPDKAEIILIMSNLVSVATEERIYPLAKMFSEIGGLSSLLFGVSCIIVFEILERLLAARCCLLSKSRRGEAGNGNNNELPSIEIVEQHSQYLPRDLSRCSSIKLGYQTGSGTWMEELHSSHTTTTFVTFPIEVLIGSLTFTSQIQIAQY